MIWGNVDLKSLNSVAAEMWSKLPQKGVVCFDAEMGCGKTTLINALAKIAGVNEETSSPTFSIVNEYLTEKGSKIYHFDCYRIEDETEAMDFGIEEYFFDNAVCLVEWPEKVKNLIPSDASWVKLKVNEDETRNIELISVS